MYSLIYFDTEDYISSPDSPVHRLPAQLADIMHKHGLTGCFHIHGEKARFMERQGQTDVITALKKHDISLHYDRGSQHPTTAEEISQLEWFQGVERVLFRELPGFQALERIFGKCSGLTQHGGTFGAPIVYAAGKLGKPFFYSPFRLPGRNIVWYCNNLLIGGYQAPFHFDAHYRDTTRFEEVFAKVDSYLDQRAKDFDFTAMFGCHPVITMMQEFPDAINFFNGDNPGPEDWVAPTPVEGVSIPLILENFERLIARLVAHPKVEWTSVAGIHKLYGQRPCRVPDRALFEGANAVIANCGPTYTNLLSAAELLYLLAKRALRREELYAVPQVMGVLEDSACRESQVADPLDLAAEVVHTVNASGYLPVTLCRATGGVTPEAALLQLACHATGSALPPESKCQLGTEAIPGVSEARENVLKFKKWRVHGKDYNQPGIIEPFRRQCWTLKPAFAAEEYAGDVELGRHLNPMF